MVESVSLGFVMPNGKTYDQENQSEGHIEIARRVIEAENLVEKYQNSKWNDPVDFLLFVEGALKVGNRWGKRVVSYYPNMLTSTIQKHLESYKNRCYAEDKVYTTGENCGESLISFFHMM